MSEAQPTTDEWRDLYDAAIRVKEIAPWGWMTETEVFGVQNPETDEIGFVSVMGFLGEHPAVAVYLGAEGLYSFWHFEQVADTAPPEALLELSQLQASFVDRSDLSQRDRDVIKELGLKFRGRQAWPMFRSYRRGFFPWYLEAAECRFLARVLEQVVEVTPRIIDKPDLLDTSDDESYLVRTPLRENGTVAWRDRVLTIPPPESEPIPVTMDVELLEYVKLVPRSDRTVEVDLLVIPIPVREGKARPYVPRVLLAVDSESERVVACEILAPRAGLEQMWGSVPDALMRHLARVGMVPGRVRVRSDLLVEMLSPIAQELGFALVQTDTLPHLDLAVESLLEHFRQSGIE